MAAKDGTLFDVLSAISDGAGRRQIEYSTRLEVATELGVDRTITDPFFDEAIEGGLVEEHPTYSESWRLTTGGQSLVDSQVFLETDRDTGASSGAGPSGSEQGGEEPTDKEA